VPSAAVAGGAAGAGLLAWLVKRLGGLGFLATLYTRLAPSRILDNAARASVYEHVKAHPGAHPSAIAETLDLGWGTVVYHLAKLEDNRLVTARSAHNKKCYFAVGADLDVEARTVVAAMSTDKTRSIVETVRASPGISQKELSEKLGMSQALASWHVKRLVASGVLLAAREGRSNCLRVAGHVPAAA
jgi:predicted transcriptional regulator